MGSSQSIRVADEETEEEDDDEEEEAAADDDGEDNARVAGTRNSLVKKVLEQEPEMLPCHTSASPLSPQLSSLGTPRLGPSIKVWDPYNVLAPPPPPPPPPPPVLLRGLGFEEDRAVTEVYLVCHGECDINLRPDLVGGRCHEAALTANGKRQARALAVFFNSQGVRFSAVYSSPLERSRSMALSVCQDMNFAEGEIQSSDALIEMSLGLWEGCNHSEVHTPEVLSLIESFQPDFCAPSGESLREVEFRMIQFLNRTVVGLPEKLSTDFTLHNQHGSQGLSHDRDVNHLHPPHWNMLHRHRQGISRKKSGKSRLQFVTTTSNHEFEDEISPREADHQTSLHDATVRSTSSSTSSCIGVFTHSIPIKCLLTGLLGCSPMMSHKICIDDSSVTVLQHSWTTGWQIKRLNDTAHLRLL
ncbi:hypothetical protein K2173_028271 [Erythroxylum novogranatense]|uniref:Uncharacterized protein n=1 Tax=Erythroxylum novogranatense TaxID=1862640 RepID=A0AAV8U4D8_9ROSI|nr:hypothetical protein K2173_028271 [Erythroxylum novogranatense]